MNPKACLDWAQEHHHLNAAERRKLKSILDMLLEAAPPGLLYTNHLQACINSRDFFRTVKLVHVAENVEPDDGQGPHPRSRPDTGGDIIQARRSSLVAFLERLNRETGARFNVRLLDECYGKIIGSGVRDWYPIVGFEYHRGSAAFPEVSLYCENRPLLAAMAAAPVLETQESWPLKTSRLFALGMDFLADGSARMKLYWSRPPSQAPELMAQLDPFLQPERVLLLQRTTEKGTFEACTKAYIPLKAKVPGRITACSGEEFPSLTRGRLREFAGSVRHALKGQHIFYIGASEEKIEIYFGHGHPADDTAVARESTNVRRQGPEPVVLQ